MFYIHLRGPPGDGCGERDEWTKQERLSSLSMSINNAAKYIIRAIVITEATD
jgi:hypothetical protein